MIRLRLLFWIAGTLCLTPITAIFVDKTGGYKDIVVRISSDVPEDACSAILANVKVNLTFSCPPDGADQSEIFCQIIS